MNGLSSQKKKFYWVLGILVLLVPIIALGMPAGSRANAFSGRLALMRQEHRLGETDLGEIDPSASAMNLVLLGLRGLAVNTLWVQMETEKNNKDWPAMRATTESIIRLQPHFEKVWEFNGWNLAFNVSAEWDSVKDRYTWVKEGGKFFHRGVIRNNTSSNLTWQLGNIYQKKIGISDERYFFRRFFISDPAPEFNGKPDPDFNPEGLDNYLVAKSWFKEANARDAVRRNSIMDPTLFRAFAARSQVDYAEVLQQEGTFGETARKEWDTAYDDWVSDYGRIEFVVPVPRANQSIKIHLELREDDLEGLTAELKDMTKEVTRLYQRMGHYPYWKERILSEREPESNQGHENLYYAKQAFKKDNQRECKRLAFEAMKNYEAVLKKHPSLISEDNFVEGCMITIFIWQEAHKLRGEDVPADFPLLELWQRHQEGLPEFRRRLNYEIRDTGSRPTDD